MGSPQNEGFVGRGEVKRWARVGLEYSIQPKAKLELRRKLLAEIFLFSSYIRKLRRLKALKGLSGFLFLSYSGKLCRLKSMSVVSLFRETTKNSSSSF